MSQSTGKLGLNFENLDTSYVNVAALIRYLRERGWSGRVHVELDEYDADIFLEPGSEPRVRERNYSTGALAEGEAALQRLLVRAREPGGLIGVYESESGETAREPVRNETRGAVTAPLNPDVKKAADGQAPDEETERDELLRLSGEMIATVERAVARVGGDFAAALYRSRLSIADDYSFIDPLTGRFEYASGGAVRLNVRTSAGLFAAGVCEALRRTVEYVVRVERREAVRQEVAREFALLARRRQSALARFKLAPQLERIAGTRLL